MPKSRSRRDVAVLGIDAAWKDGNPSGVALVVRNAGRTEIVKACPCFGTFVDRCSPTPKVEEVIGHARKLAGPVPLACVAVDMPLARVPITKRRAADNNVSHEFGEAGCGTHSPSKKKPGSWGRRIGDAVEAAGFRLRVDGDASGVHKSLIEVYPHPALLSLTGARKVLRYKLKHPVEVRRRAYRRIVGSLCESLPGADDLLPGRGLNRGQWKAVEDRLDAVICCWVALEFLDERAIPYGDRNAAIWIPAAR